MTLTRRAFLLASPAALIACTGGKPRVVLYCAQDRAFALDLLGDFRQWFGLDVAPKFDTEANKPVGLCRALVAEKGRFLLSAEVENRLAEGPSARVPLNPDVKTELPPRIETPAKLKVMQVDWANAASSWDEAQKYATRYFAAG